MTAPMQVKRYPIRGAIFGLLLGLAAAIYLVIFSVIPFGSWIPTGLAVVGGIAVGVSWAMFAPARGPKGAPVAQTSGGYVPAQQQPVPQQPVPQQPVQAPPVPQQPVPQPPAQAPPVPQQPVPQQPVPQQPVPQQPAPQPPAQAPPAQPAPPAQQGYAPMSGIPGAPPPPAPAAPIAPEPPPPPPSDAGGGVHQTVVAQPDDPDPGDDGANPFSQHS